MMVFILKFSACLLILHVFYKLVLEKESVHVFKRFYLLAIVAVALLIPFITFTTVIIESSDADLVNVPVFLPETDLVAEGTSKNWTVIILWSIYSIGVLLFGFKFASNLLKLRFKIKSNPKLRFNGFTNVLIKGLKVPYTFLSYIFINKSAFENNEIPNEVFLHEQAHAKQKHTLDILFLELIQIVFWFNPMFYWLKRDMKQNHEYLADRAVLNKGINITLYQELLLSFTHHKTDKALVNAFNYSSIKKRLTIMKTQTSKTQSWLKGLILLPLLAVLVYSFSEKKTIIEENPTDFAQISSETPKLTEGATDAMMQEYRSFIEEFKTTRTIMNDSYKRAVAIYEIMTKEQRESVEKYPEIPMLVDLETNNAKKRKATPPTTALLNEWKDKSNYAVWIDGKVVDNALLSKYQASDFVHYFKSKVYDNARSKQFPQPFQVSVYTKSYYEANFTNRDVKEYNRLAKNYTNALKVWSKGDRSDNSELKILKALADKVYNNFSEEKKSKFNLRPTPPLPAEYSKEKTQKGATKEEIQAYNVWAKKEKARFNKTPKSKKWLGYPTLINDETFRYYHSIYERMTPQQQKSAESLPEAVLLPESPIPNSVDEDKVLPLNNSQQQVTKEEIKSYNIWAKKINTAIALAEKTKNTDSPKSYPLIKVKDVEKYKSIYGRMTDKQRKSVEPFPNLPKTPPPPPAPKKEWKKVEKPLSPKQKKSQASKKAPKPVSIEVVKTPPPPPPPPMNMKKLAKKGAEFYYEGKKVTAEKAISLYENNKDLHVQVSKYDSKKPIVKISKAPIVIEEKN